MSSTTDVPMVVPLADSRALDARLTGNKASTLAALAIEGHPVPAGFVLTTAAFEANGGGPRLRAAARAALAESLAAVGGPVAVRSSGVAEDLAGASFAGQYETVLDVEGEAAVLDAVGRCLASAESARVRAYRDDRRVDAAPMAVLVQRMIPARAAGVAFTAHPVTGERDVVTISAVAGLGEALVSGASDGEEWEVRGETAVRRRGATPVLREEDAREIARLSRSVARGGSPVDVEWAFDGPALRLLQARPMTALPEPVSWEVDHEVPFVRNFRLGEWIGAPLTPLSESWLVTDLEEALHERQRVLWGMEPPRPLHILVNGWYFYGGLNYDVLSGWFWLRCLPTILRNLPLHFREMMSVSAKPLGFHQEAARWRAELLPAYRSVVAEAEESIDGTAPDALVGLVQRLVDAAGAQFTSIVGVSGYAASMELELISFLKKHARAEAHAVQELIVGAELEPSRHDVEGLDWVFPTLGERGPLPAGPGARLRDRLRARAAATEARVREVLPPKRRKSFDRMVAEARTAHAVRQEQTGLFTLAWPAMRRALARIGGHLVARGSLERPEDIHFLARTELEEAIAGATTRPAVAERRASWERQRRLAPPLQIGKRTGLYAKIWDHLEPIMHHEEHDAADALRGMPGSPGRVTGAARVIHSVDELDRLRPGEILVAPVTTPAWTPAFLRAAAVVTDTGSIASHASIVAREHGLPAVVGTGGATAIIVDGQRITVDGSLGVVRLAG